MGSLHHTIARYTQSQEIGGCAIWAQQVLCINFKDASPAIFDLLKLLAIFCSVSSVSFRMASIIFSVIVNQQKSDEKGRSVFCCKLSMFLRFKVF